MFAVFPVYSNGCGLKGALESGKISWFAISLFGLEMIKNLHIEQKELLFERGLLSYTT